MKKNLDKATVESFGDEWGRFNQSDLPAEEAQARTGPDAVTLADAPATDGLAQGW